MGGTESWCKAGVAGAAISISYGFVSITIATLPAMFVPKE